MSSPVANPGVVPFIDWNEAIFRADLSYKAKAVLHTIRYFMNAASGEAWPSCETIAKKTGCSKRTAINAIAEAVAAGFLVKKSRYDKSGHRTSNLYIRSVPISMAEAYAESDECGGVEVDGAPSELSDEKVALRLSARGAQELQEGYSSDEEYKPPLPLRQAEGGVSPEKPKGTKPRNPHFEEFYNTYPRKRCVDQAERTWRRVVKSEEIRLRVMAGLTARLPELRLRPMDKIPYPSTWLNSGDWKDVEIGEQASPPEDEFAAIYRKAEEDLRIDRERAEREREEARGGR